MSRISLSLISLCAALTSLPLQAADEVFCEDYAQDLINLPNAREGAPKTCQKDQSHWNSDKTAHIKWCRGVDEAKANKRRYHHNNLVNLCNDSYKLIMIDRKRVASLPINADEEMQMDSASANLKKALTSGAIESPYSEMYPSIVSAIKSGRLKKCDFYSLAVDMDKNQDSKEWVVSTDNTCLPDHQDGHIWLIQQVDNQYRILFEGESHTLNLRQTESNQYKNISIDSQLSAKEETDKRCGSIKAEWHYSEGRYIPFQGQAHENGSCLPEYNLPDYLQGENTFELATGEWEKGMKAEEKKRIALFAPYKKALEDYIPEWIKNREDMITSNPSSKGSDSTTVKVQQETGSSKIPPQTDHSDKEDKTFMQNVRAFLGLTD